MPEPRSLSVTYTAPTEQDQVSVGHPDIPARLVDGDAMRVDHEGLDQVINLDIEVLEEVEPEVPASSLWVPVWDSANDVYRRRAYSAAGMVDWDDITNKPATFPPTVPIDIDDVTGLQAQLDALEATNDAQNVLIVALEDVTQDLEDRVEVLEDGVEATDITWTQDGTGAVETTVDAKLKETFSAEDFGVVLNGTTDNATALTAAFTAAMTAGKKLRITGSGVGIISLINLTLTGDLHVEVDPGVTLKGTAEDEGAILTFDGGASRYTFTWHGGTIDNSVRPYVAEVASGTCLYLKRIDDFTVTHVTFHAGDDYSDGFGDTGLGPEQCRRGLISHCRFNAQPDLGVYITGGGSNLPTDDHGDIIVTDCHFYRCLTGLSAKRQSPRTIVSNCLFYACAVGVSLWEASTTILPGRQAVISNNIFKFTEQRGIEIRVYDGSVVSGNIFEDFGYESDGVTPTLIGCAVRIQGGTRNIVTGNTVRALDWPTHAACTAFIVVNHTIDAVVYTAADNLFDGNSIHDVYAGVRETSTGINVYRNHMTGYTTGSGGLNVGSLFQFTDTDNQDRWYYGATEMLRVNADNVVLRGLRFFETLSSAAVPANFSATKYLEVKDSTGATFYLPVAAATW